MSKKERFRILIETLLRAAIQGIPWFGSSLDQLTFGFRDAYEAAKYKESIELLSQQVAALLDSRPASTLGDVPQLATQLLLSEKLSGIKEQLTGEGSTFAHYLPQLVQHIESAIIEQNTQLIHSISNLNISLGDRITNAVNQVGDSQRELIQRIEELYEQVEMLARPKAQKEPNLLSLQAIVAELKTINSKPIVHAAGLFANAFSVHHNQFNTPLLWAVDTFEIVNYGRAPYNAPIDFSHLAVTFMFSACSKPYVLFPWVAAELLKYLKLARNALSSSRYKDLRASISSADSIDELSPYEIDILASIGFPGQSPYERMVRLLREGKLILHENKLPEDEHFNELRDKTMEILENYRPHSRLNNFIDANTLAYIKYLNQQQPRSTVLISGSPLLSKVASLLTRSSQTEDFVISPKVKSVCCYLDKFTRDDLSKFETATQEALESDQFIDLLLKTLEKVQADSLLNIAGKIREFKKSLDISLAKIEARDAPNETTAPLPL